MTIYKMIITWLANSDEDNCIENDSVKELFTSNFQDEADGLSRGGGLQ